MSQMKTQARHPPPEGAPVSCCGQCDEIRPSGSKLHCADGHLQRCELGGFLVWERTWPPPKCPLAPDGYAAAHKAASDRRRAKGVLARMGRKLPEAN
jgi:hypothetical protein